jgi:hypothetical protein
MVTKLNFDLYCRWYQIEPTYRIYVNDDLITERTWNHPNGKEYRQEEILVNLDLNKEHNLMLIPVARNNPIFEIKNFSINNDVALSQVGLDHKFTVSQ